MHGVGDTPQASQFVARQWRRLALGLPAPGKQCSS